MATEVRFCMTCNKKHGGNFYMCKDCGYVSCQKDGGTGKCPKCKKINRKPT